MKTTISIPDSVFEAAEAFARRLGISRSELYAKAISVYIKEHRDEGVTEALNRIYVEKAPSVDPFIQSFQFSSLPKDEW